MAVRAGINFGDSAQFGVRSENEIDAGTCPALFTGDAILADEYIVMCRRWCPRCTNVEEVHEEVVGQHAWTRSQHTVRCAAGIGIQCAHTADECCHLRCVQRQELGLVNKQLFGVDRQVPLGIVAEPIGDGLQHGKRFNVGMLLRCIRAARSERNRYCLSGSGGSLLDADTSAEDDHVGHRDALAVCA